MADHWSPDDIERMMVSSTACICLFMFVAGSLWLLKTGTIGATVMGAVSGSGLLGIGTLLLRIIRIAIRR